MADKHATDSRNGQFNASEHMELLPIGEIFPNAFNPKDSITSSPEIKQHYLAIKKSLKTNGQVAPIVVRETGHKHYEIVDGFHRWTACKELGYQYMSVVNLGTVSEAQARQLLINIEKAKVPVNEVKLGQLVSDLHIKEGDLIYKTLPFTKDKTNEYIELAKFNWELQSVQPSVYTNWAIKCTQLERNSIVLAFKALQSKFKDSPPPQLLLSALHHYAKSIKPTKTPTK